MRDLLRLALDADPDRSEIHAEHTPDGLRLRVRERERRPAPEPAGPSRALPMELRADGDTLYARLSNDTVRDAFGTIITVEALHEWADGYRQHRTVNLQHAKELRGIPGRHMVGVTTRMDFNPQLELEIRLHDPLAKELVRDGKIRGVSMEFVPEPDGTEAVLQDHKPALLHKRVSAEPEATGVALTDIPAVPGAEVLAHRSADDLPNWAYAVVDPKVLNGEVTDPGEVAGLRWYPHHELSSRVVDQGAAIRALQEIERGEVTVPDGASLSREEVSRRALDHFHRHLVTRVGLPGVGYRKPVPRSAPRSEIT